MFDFSVSPEGDRVAVALMISSSKSDIYEIDMATGQSRRVLETNEDVFFGKVAYGKDGRSFVHDHRFEL